jgi:alkyl sulfatase BDS1-like metallo-beta-lactamase superfamily hydrolase
VPARTWVAGLTTRLKAEDTLAVDTTMAFRFPDVKESYGLEVRRGAAQFYERAPERADVAIEMPKKALDRILLGQSTLVRALNSGDIRITAGSRADVLKFFEYFEPAAGDPIMLTVR